MSYWVMADGRRWELYDRTTIQARWNLSAAVKLATELDELGYENVHIVGQ
jgi:hypothetical protein